MFKTILIDDEPAARRLMRSLLLEHASVISVVAEAGNGREAIELVNELKPDLIFLDIQMQDMNGFEVIEQLIHKPNIIFTTAYEQYAMKAFDTFSIDYLLKPIKEERLSQGIEKLQQFGRLNKQVDMESLQELINQLKVPQQPTALPIRTGDRISLIRFETIAFLAAEDKYVYIHTTDGQKFITDQPLSVLVNKLPNSFYRIQKSYIINKDRIKEMHRHLNGRYLFIMEDKSATRLTSGRTYYEAIKADFGI